VVFVSKEQNQGADMRKLGMWAMALAICGVVFLTGCGGGDDDSKSLSPASLRGRTFTLSGDAGPSSITFADSGDLYSLARSDVQLAPVGTFRAHRFGNTWRVEIVTPDGRFTSELILTYAAGGRGTYRFTEPGWLESETGLFEEVGFVGNPVPPDPSAPGVPGSPVLAPQTLTQIIMTGASGNPGGSQTVSYSFANTGAGSGTFTDGTTRSGTFTYSATSGNTGNLRLVFADANLGDVFDYSLSFFTGNAGTFMGNEKVGAVEGQASGSFNYSGLP
jgi:hypothetical protein